MAPVCSSFVFANTSNTKRCAQNFMGDTSYEPVASGNLMADIAGFLMRVAKERGRARGYSANCFGSPGSLGVQEFGT